MSVSILIQAEQIFNERSCHFGAVEVSGVDDSPVLFALKREVPFSVTLHQAGKPVRHCGHRPESVHDASGLARLLGVAPGGSKRVFKT